VASRLTAEHDRLAELNCGDLAVRASFRQSYDSLPAAQAKASCLLGTMPSRSFSLAPVTALLGLGKAATERTLDALCEAHMLDLGGVGTDFVTALDAYGHTLRALDNETDALAAWREAAVLAESQSDPRAAQIRERLALGDGADVVSRR
jgi:hypothetical protein